jgi:peptide deformylase
MAILKIVHYGDPILHKKGKNVSSFDSSLASLGKDMIETMHHAEGIGLAAQQIGKELQFCVVDLREAEAEFTYTYDGGCPPMDLFMPLVIVNPEVTTIPEPQTIYEEGCLSFPKITGKIVRPDAIHVNFQDIDGNSHQMACNGLLARCILHEIDHLNGVLFIDRMKKEERTAIESDIKQLRKRTRKAYQ